ncbi:zinc-ribbon and DUF3426 domain-containing protein [Variovorax sp. YR216]|uniref:zinc-ribbon and DUF3426 domain-containing protein n=1 Tax=Variovorax sp. YR216 TaxID=1882828 RepID=UPI00089A641B|nr:zinc-ribbon and DUF3426 domain-containing protein [Variovorax sp. YR216]SEA99432.1 MJ0042 family finger-like domain-containing protein [Variovorax sp. YR216]
MSLVTRCPACATPFKVVRDQLRISDGWVRCGRCSQVFDATVDLQDAAEFHVETPAPPISSALDAPMPDEVVEAIPGDVAAPIESAEAFEPPAGAQQPEGESISADAETDFYDDLHEALTAVQALPAPESVSAAPLAAYDDDADRAHTPAREMVPDVAWPDADMLSLGDEGRLAVRPPVPPPLSFPDIDLSLPSSLPAAAVPAPVSAVVPTDAGSIPDDGSNVQLQKALRRARAKSAKIAKAKARGQKVATVETAPVVLSASEPEPSTEPMVAEMPPFFGAEAAKSFWQRPAVRGLMALLAFLGVVLLLGQMVYQERDLIVARQPSLRPALQSMCRVFGCEVSALRQINDIKVDGASFAREKNDDGYRFSFTLRNGAEVPLAMPAVELSLLDTQERAVVRRVLMPAEFGAPNVLPARSERSASLSLRLTGPEAALMPPVVGFRVETLYP